MHPGDLYNITAKKNKTVSVYAVMCAGDRSILRVWFRLMHSNLNSVHCVNFVAGRTNGIFATGLLDIHNNNLTLPANANMYFFRKRCPLFSMQNLHLSLLGYLFDF